MIVFVPQDFKWFSTEPFERIVSIFLLENKKERTFCESKKQNKVRPGFASRFVYKTETFPFCVQNRDHREETNLLKY